mmetsp:Transcript_24736/g.71420  ORF Transcript_24736/g.71420 Transcript_24736/m.71420 type:complete len:205 (+) Transcript_24736:943-1557(+)
MPRWQPLIPRTSGLAFAVATNRSIRFSWLRHLPATGPTPHPGLESASSTDGADPPAPRASRRRRRIAWTPAESRRAATRGPRPRQPRPCGGPAPAQTRLLGIPPPERPPRGAPGWTRASLARAPSSTHCGSEMPRPRGLGRNSCATAFAPWRRPLPTGWALGGSFHSECPLLLILHGHVLPLSASFSAFGDSDMGGTQRFSVLS